jgi:hypothetical protein
VYGDHLAGNVRRPIRAERRNGATNILRRLLAAKWNECAGGAIEGEACAILNATYRGAESFPDFRIDQAECDGIDTDPLRTELQSERAG